MPIIKNETLQSDQINILSGFDGSEPKEVEAWNRLYKDSFPFRVAFAINQHYPELRSGFYRNRRLVALIQEALVKIGLLTVIDDNYRSEGVVPSELPGSLEICDDYLLVNEAMQVRGRLGVWESLGGKSDFYHDRFVLEVLSDAIQVSQIINSVEQECCKHSVAYKLFDKHL